MKESQFLKAITILSINHSTKILINKPNNGYVGNLGSTEFTIDIIDCCASVMNNLIDKGYYLSMKDGLTSVNHYGGIQD